MGQILQLLMVRWDLLVRWDLQRRRRMQSLLLLLILRDLNGSEVCSRVS